MALPLIAAGITAVGGLISSLISNGEHEKARRLLERAQAQFGDIALPQLKEIVAEQLGPSAFEQITQDPKLRQAEYDSLNSLKDMADSGGFTLEDKANLNRVQNQVARNESAGRGAIAEQFAARGQLGSGAQLAMSLANQQNAAQQAGESGLQVAADARKRAFEAIQARARQAAGMDEKDYNKQSNLASARDRIAAANANARTDASRYNNGIKQQQFGNQVALAQGKAGQAGQMADYISKGGDRTAATVTNFTGSLVDGVGEVDKYLKLQKEKK